MHDGADGIHGLPTAATAAADRTYTVGQAARLAGVTVRTLHHYEQVGLLIASDRSGAGYRLYGAGDLDRLTRILYYRELGFALEDIARMLGTDDGDRQAVIAEHLDRQHRLLTERLARIRTMLAALEKERNALTMGHELTAEEKLEIFGADYDPSWEDEAADRWGGTQAWKQSQARSASRSKADWRQIKAAGDAWNAQVVEAYRAGVTANSPAATALAEQHRAMVAEHYDCSYAMHRQLADMYLADPRMTEYYEKQAPGLAQWVHDAIHANADLHPDDQGEGFC